MPVQRSIPFTSGMFFITFTCTEWLNLISIVKGYDIIYNWFDILKSNGHFINGYVIMPNHVHSLISFRKESRSINTIIGSGKRFMAYEIINRLERQSDLILLKKLAANVELARRKNKKLHNVWEPSFDWKNCISESFVKQKLDYIHLNPCRGKWNLSDNPTGYKHSSGFFYQNDVQGFYQVTSFSDMQDVHLDN